MSQRVQISPATSPLRRGGTATTSATGPATPGHPVHPRSTSAGTTPTTTTDPNGRRYTSYAATDSSGRTSRKRRRKVLGALALVVAIVLLCIIVVPPAVVLTNRQKDNKENDARDGRGQVVTTVVDGRTEVLTLDGVTRTQTTTLANGDTSVVTSFVAVPDVTVSLTSLASIVPDIFTTTISGDIVVIASQTNFVTDVATITFTALGGIQSVRTVTLTDLDIVTIVGPAPTSTATTVTTASSPFDDRAFDHDDRSLCHDRLVDFDHGNPDDFDWQRSEYYDFDRERAFRHFGNLDDFKEWSRSVFHLGGDIGLRLDLGSDVPSDFVRSFIGYHLVEWQQPLELRVVASVNQFVGFRYEHDFSIVCIRFDGCLVDGDADGANESDHCRSADRVDYLVIYFEVDVNRREWIVHSLGDDDNDDNTDHCRSTDRAINDNQYIPGDIVVERRWYDVDYQLAVDERSDPSTTGRPTSVPSDSTSSTSATTTTSTSIVTIPPIESTTSSSSAASSTSSGSVSTSSSSTTSRTNTVDFKPAFDDLDEHLDRDVHLSKLATRLRTRQFDDDFDDDRVGSTKFHDVSTGHNHGTSDRGKHELDIQVLFLLEQLDVDVSLVQSVERVSLCHRDGLEHVGLGHEPFLDGLKHVVDLEEYNLDFDLDLNDR
ncbi:hypothetical protein JCM10212_006282 [Sporobolomyces blumeae]